MPGNSGRRKQGCEGPPPDQITKGAGSEDLRSVPRRRSRSLRPGSCSNQRYREDYISQKACPAVRAPAGRSQLREGRSVRGAEHESPERWLSARSPRPRARPGGRNSGTGLTWSARAGTLDGRQRRGSSGEGAGVREAVGWHRRRDDGSAASLFACRCRLRRAGDRGKRRPRRVGDGPREAVPLRKRKGPARQGPGSCPAPPPAARGCVSELVPAPCLPRARPGFATSPPPARPACTGGGCGSLHDLRRTPSPAHPGLGLELPFSFTNFFPSETNFLGSLDISVVFSRI